MKSTGIIKKVDDLGRIIIPAEIRSEFGLYNNDQLEIFIEGSYIIFKKVDNTCIFCNSTTNLIEYKNKFICPDCLAHMDK